jgi:hypothetical protein
VFSGAEPDAPRCAITQGFRMVFLILAENLSLLFGPYEPRCVNRNDAFAPARASSARPLRFLNDPLPGPLDVLFFGSRLADAHAQRKLSVQFRVRQI